MASISISLNHDAIDHLLKVDAVPLLEELGGRILNASPEGCEMQTFVGRTRARVTVRTATFEAMVAEARDRALTRALDAARG